MITFKDFEIILEKLTASKKKRHIKEMKRFLKAFELTLDDIIIEKHGSWQGDHITKLYKIETNKPKPWLYIKLYISKEWGPLMRIGWFSRKTSNKNIVLPSVHFKTIKHYNKYLDVLLKAVKEHDLKIMGKFK
jgi:hypothetical protein